MRASSGAPCVCAFAWCARIHVCRYTCERIIFAYFLIRFSFRSDLKLSVLTCLDVLIFRSLDHPLACDHLQNTHTNATLRHTNGWDCLDTQMSRSASEFKNHHFVSKPVFKWILIEVANAINLLASIPNLHFPCGGDVDTDGPKDSNIPPWRFMRLHGDKNQ